MTHSWGSADADEFIFSGTFGTDIIFACGSGDIVNLGGVVSIDNFNDLINNYTSQSGSDALISDGSGNMITLDGVNILSLTEGDFSF